MTAFCFARHLFNFCCRGNQGEFEVVAEAIQYFKFLAAGFDQHFGLQGGTDGAGYANFFNCLVTSARIARKLAYWLPMLAVGDGWQLIIRLRKDRFITGSERIFAAKFLPCFFGCERQSWCHQTQQTLRDVPDRCLCRATRERRWCRWCTNDLSRYRGRNHRDLRAEGLQFADHRMEFKGVVMRQDFFLQCGGARSHSDRFRSKSLVATASLLKSKSEVFANKKRKNYGCGDRLRSRASRFRLRSRTTGVIG